MFKKSTLIPPKILLFMEKTIECEHFVQLKSFLIKRRHSYIFVAYSRPNGWTEKG